MAETISIDVNTSKAEVYEQLVPQIKALIGDEVDQISIYANVSAALAAGFNHLWIGFYRVVDEELVLGPFQGPVACSRIAFGRGVCGTSCTKRETIIVPDVDAFPGHIACSSESRSEIVVPVLDASGNVIAVLDIDSRGLNAFDEVDQQYLEQICAFIGERL